MLAQTDCVVASAASYIGAMLHDMPGLIRRQWHRVAIWLSACWRRLWLRDQSLHFPMTSLRMEKLCDAIVASIDQDKVCAFTSRHSNGMACEFLEMNRGSYNISIRLGFFGVIPDRLLRIPLRPTVRDSWTKIQSEVATLEYIREKTTIPVPKVWAYGKDARIIKDSCQAHHYLLCDYMPGQCLTQMDLVRATSEQRMELFSQLIGIYAQLYDLGFPVATSLLPKRQPVNTSLGGLLTMARNELQLSMSKALPKPQILHSTDDYIQHQLDILSESCRQPLIDGALIDERNRVFALHHIKLALDTIMRDSPSSDGEPFILAHPDLHYANIIVDKRLNIVGIIDWEFAGTVPRCLFTPPAWATGHHWRGRLGPPTEVIRDFRKAMDQSRHEELKKHWLSAEKCPNLFATAQILRIPFKLEDVFYKSIFPNMFNGSQSNVVADYFAADENATLAKEADRRLRHSESYTAHLKTTGLYEDIEEDYQRQVEADAKILKMLSVLK